MDKNDIHVQDILGAGNRVPFPLRPRVRLLKQSLYVDCLWNQAVLHPDDNKDYQRQPSLVDVEHMDNKGSHLASGFSEKHKKCQGIIFSLPLGSLENQRLA